MKICTLASGSSGNSLFIQTKFSKILVDAGISLRQIKARLKKLDVELSDLDAAIISHEHLDHAMSIPKIENPTYVASATIHLWKDKAKNLYEFSTGSSFSIKDVLITPFSVPHDALDPVGFTIETDHKKLGIVTDIGTATNLVKERLKGSNILIIEFNHDENILRESNYPWEIKQRIMSRLGHLSNVQAANLFAGLLHGELSHLLLAHLSEANNKSDIALRAASSIIEKSGADHISISIAPRKTLGEVLII
ncbi:MAG: MBL fold metallo-hydrolase [Deltaproteobacteria bacterium]|nr:MBL fold metallo-hydrolase [Deltaproteobacteria bacterium]